MAQLKICRICIRSKIKMYHINSYNLKSFYEEVTSIQITDDDLPQHLCYECSTLIYKFHTFKDKCHRGNNILKALLWENRLTYEEVLKIDRKDLESSLQIMSVTKRVKLFIDKTNCLTGNILESNEKPEVHFKQEISTNDNLIEPKQEYENFEDSNRIENKESLCENADFPMKDEKCFDNSDKVANTGDTSDDSDHQPLITIRNKPKSAIKMKNKISNSTTVDAKRKDIRPKKLKFKFERKTKDKRLSKIEEVILNSKNWAVETLNEEQAIKEFRCKPEDPKYVDAEFKCTDCYKQFSNSDIMLRHRKLMHDDKLKNQFECRFCKMRYKRKGQLSRHISGHYKKYYCARCNFVCSSSNTAFLHDEYHSGLRRTCQHCGKQFRHSSSFYTHLRLSHKCEFICAQCGVACISEAGLDMHKRKKHVEHEGSKDPKPSEEVYCMKCDIRFVTRKAYDQHFAGSANHPEKNRRIRNGKEKLYKKPCTCYQCGKSFDTQANYFKHHKKAHPRTSVYEENVICEICGASLKPGSVKAHLNVHTKEQTFTCDTCGREFNSYVSMKRHYLTHTGEKPHGCLLCEKRFTQRGSMMLHYRTFHLKQPYPKRNRNRRKKGYIEMSAFQNSQEQK